MIYRTFLTRIVLVFLITHANAQVSAQDQIDLQTCLDAVRSTHPLANNKANFEKLITINHELLKAYNKPSLNFASDARIQSEALSFNLPIPNAQPIELPIYSVQAYGQANFNVLTGHIPNLTAELQNLEINLNNNKNDISLYKINEEIARLYYSIILIRKSKDILLTVNSDIKRKKKQIENAIKSGIKSKLDLQRLEFEIASLIAQIQDAILNDSLLCNLMNEMTHLNISSKTIFKQDIAIEQSNTRPEINQFSLAKSILSKKIEIIDAGLKPKLGAFIRGGIGYPNPLNFFDDNISPFAILGLSFKWPIYDWNITNLKKSTLAVQNDIIDQNKSAFIWQQDIKETQQNTQITRLKNQIISDNNQLRLQHKIIKSVEQQWHNGIATAYDYLNEMNKLKILNLKINTKEIQIMQWESLQWINRGIK